MATPLIVDLDLRGKRLLLIGGGPETERKAWMFLDAGADLTVAAAEHARTLVEAAEKGRLDLLTIDTSVDLSVVDGADPRPDFVVVHTANDGPEEPEIARRAKARGCLVYVVDDMEHSDFVQPAVANAGFVQVAVSTGGRSPPMARILARRLADAVQGEDLGMVEVLEQARKRVRELIPDPESRREVLYGLAEDGKLAALLRKGDVEAATGYAEERIWSAAGRG